jgi:hypothetical protein
MITVQGLSIKLRGKMAAVCAVSRMPRGGPIPHHSITPTFRPGASNDLLDLLTLITNID